MAPLSATDLLKEGRLDEALADLQAQVRTKPADAKLRIFLAQLLLVLGQWERALNQLNVAQELDAGALAMARTYQQAVSCEALRAQVFEGKRTPLVFGDPQDWIALAFEALARSGAGAYAEAAKIRDEAWDKAPTTSGTIDGKPFEWICDADSRIGPMLEAVVNGGYYWIPFHRIARIDLEEPADLRDFVWTPVHLQFANGGETVGLVPTRYAGSEAHEDPLVRLARKTEWTEAHEDEFHGAGQRIFTTDGDDHAILDVRVIELESVDDSRDSGDA